MTRACPVPALLALLLLGCASPPLPGVGEVTWVGGEPADSALVLRHLERERRSYVRDHAMPTVALLVLWPRPLPTSGQHGGWTTWSRSWCGAVVHLDWHRPELLPHEIHHALLAERTGDGDTEHRDPSWAGIGGAP